MPEDGREGSGDSELTKALTGIAEGQKSLTTLLSNQAASNQQTQQLLQSLTETLSKGLTVNQPEPSSNEEPPDFSAMGPGDIAQFVLKQVESMNETTRKEFQEKFDGLRRDGDVAQRRLEIQTVREQEGNEDFDYFLDEMKLLTEKNPTLSIEQLLVLARQENPEKAKEFRAELEKKSKDSDEGKNKEEETQFLGMFPTSNPATELPDGSKIDKPKNMKEGVLKAWDEVVPKSVDRTIREEDSLL